MKADSKHLVKLNNLLYSIPLDQPQDTVIHGGQIDHMFANFPMMTERVYTQPSQSSDHLPVVAEMNWRPELLQQIGKVGAVTADGLETNSHE
jgi:hypothetical protein